MSGYEIVTWVHSYLRWLILLALVFCSARFIRAWQGKKAFDPQAARLLKSTVGLLDLQLVLGLLLYVWLSPITTLAFADMGQAMRSAALRFFVVEHVLMMVLAIVFAHVTSVRVRRATEDRVRNRRAAIGMSATLALVLVGIPWPFMAYGRPLLRALG
jgi:hypothetical protein